MGDSPKSSCWTCCRPLAHPLPEARRPLSEELRTCCRPLAHPLSARGPLSNPLLKMRGPLVNPQPETRGLLAHPLPEARRLLSLSTVAKSLVDAWVSMDSSGFLVVTSVS